MKFSLKGLLTIAAAASALVLAGCGEKTVDNSKVKIGVIAGAEAQVAEVAAKVAKEKYNLDVETGYFHRLRNTKRGSGRRFNRRQRIPTQTIPGSANC